MTQVLQGFPDSEASSLTQDFLGPPMPLPSTLSPLLFPNAVIGFPLPSPPYWNENTGSRFKMLIIWVLRFALTGTQVESSHMFLWTERSLFQILPEGQGHFQQQQRTEHVTLHHGQYLKFCSDSEPLSTTHSNFQLFFCYRYDQTQSLTFPVLFQFCCTAFIYP